MTIASIEILHVYADGMIFSGRNFNPSRKAGGCSTKSETNTNKSEFNFFFKYRRKKAINQLLLTEKVTIFFKS